MPKSPKWSFLLRFSCTSFEYAKGNSTINLSGQIKMTIACAEMVPKTVTDD